MVLSFSISPESEARLKARAAEAGVDIETFAARALERIAAKPTLDETLAPLRSQFETSGMSEDELTELLEQVKHEDRAERRARQAS